MKKISLLFVALLLFPLLFSCGKDTPPAEGPAAVLYRIRDASSFKDLVRCYSRDTGSVVRDLIDDKVLSEEQARGVLALVDKSTTFEIAAEKRSGRGARVTILITDHRIENRIGTRMELSFLLEGGKWVVDMEEALRETGKRYRKSNAGDYFKKRFSSYQ